MSTFMKATAILAAILLGCFGWFLVLTFVSNKLGFGWGAALGIGAVFIWLWASIYIKVRGDEQP